MANQVMNVGRGKVGYYGDPALGLSAANSRLVVVALEAAEADDALNNHDTLQALLAAAGNTEVTSVGYARKEHAAAGVTKVVDDTTNTARVELDADDTWSSVSQAGSESWVKLVVCWEANNATATDADLVPLTHHDFAVTPNGGDITADYDQVNGFWSSS